MLMPKPLPPPKKTKKDASRRYQQLMPDLIARAKQALAESGCWLFVAGDHSSCTSANSFMHYESPAILADTYLQTTKVINKFGATVQALLTLGKQEVVQLNNTFIEASQQKEIAQKEASHAWEELTSKVNENVAYQSLVSGLMNGTVSLVGIPNLLPATPATS
ncbi:hypothetical protein DXG01_004774 [Tephrocybe rancida]|nr:hypothetical protein DXG01_004774 [Tephrocybe rancida]